ncbi:hypothetical protein [Methanospirillum sp.]
MKTRTSPRQKTGREHLTPPDRDISRKVKQASGRVPRIPGFLLCIFINSHRSGRLSGGEHFQIFVKLQGSHERSKIGREKTAVVR